MEINITSSTVMSYRDLMRTIQKLLYTSWGNNKVRFTSAYPKKATTENVAPPIITYKVLSKTPGAFGSKNTTELKPRHRETITIEEAGKKIAVEFLGQVFDYKILFELWSEDGESADELVERFQQFMFQYTGFLKKIGVSEIFFESMDSDSGSAEWKTDLIKRSIVYHIRLDEVLGIRSSVIENIITDAVVHDSEYHMIFDIIAREKNEESNNQP